MTSDGRMDGRTDAGVLSTLLNILHSYRRSAFHPSFLRRGIPDEYVNMNERTSERAATRTPRLAA